MRGGVRIPLTTNKLGKAPTLKQRVEALTLEIARLNTETRARNDDRKQMARFLAICAKKAGDKIVLTRDDLNSLPTNGVLTRKDDHKTGSITFGWKAGENHEY